MAIISIILLCLIVCGEGQANSEPPLFMKAERSGGGFAYVDSTQSYKIEIGGFDDGKLRSEISLSSLRNRGGFTIKLPERNPQSSITSPDSGCTLELHNASCTNRFYMLSNHDFEWEIILNERPDTDTLQFPLESRNLIFYYQDPAVFKAHENEYDFAENVPGSYAAYYTKASGNGSKSGKAFHIYRPFAQDNSGEKIWCDLVIDTLQGLLSIAMPAEFLADAKYPVIIDPTFGCTTRGATGMHMDTNNFRHQVNYGGHSDADGYMQTACICGYRTSSGAVCSVTVAVYSYAATLDSCRKISVTNKMPVTRVSINPDSAEWISAAISGNLQDDKEYVVSWQGWESCDYCLRICADYTGQWGYERRSNYADWGTNNNLAGYQSNGYRYSIYVEYEDSTAQGDPYIRSRKVKRRY